MYVQWRVDVSFYWVIVVYGVRAVLQEKIVDQWEEELVE